MKSLNFTVLKEKLISGEKTQTIRCLFIPPFVEGEIIGIRFRKKLIFHAKITEIYPKKLNEITYEESIRDGFNSPYDCIKDLMEINNLKHANRYCFIIRFKKVINLNYYLGEGKNG